MTDPRVPAPDAHPLGLGDRDLLEGNRLVFESSSQGILFQDASGAITRANPSAERILGLTPDAMRGRMSVDPRWGAIYEDGSPFPGEDHPSMKALRTGQPVTDEIMGITNPLQEGTRWIQVTALPVTRPGEVKPHQVMVTFTDITERKRSETLLAKVTAQVPGVVYQYRLYPDGRSCFPYASAGISDIYEVTPESVRDDATPVFHCIHPEDLQATADAIQESARLLSLFHWEFRVVLPRQGLRWRLCDAKPERMPDGGTLWYGIITDITERKQAEVERSQFIERISDAFVALDRNWYYTYVNAKAGQLFGRRPEDLIGKHIWTEFPEGVGQKFHLAYEQAMRTQEEVVLEEYYPPYDQWFENHIYPSPEGLTIYFQDISERKKAEQERLILQNQLHQVQKMESLGSLAGGVAHDMNNVLGAVLGLASANLGAHPPGSPTRHAFETIIKAAERGGKMVKGLLGFARQSAAEERRLDMNEILKEEVHLLERTTLAKVRINMDFAPDLRPILGDASALTHAFMNLCVNAVDAMPDHGTLTLLTHNLGSDWIEVRVEDTGSGMPKEILDRAMDPFFTTKEQGKGTGLGLSLVYSTVKAHRGEIEIQSEPGIGTCVKMRFPALSPASPEASEVGADPEPAAHGLKVMVVDDDELIQSSMAMLLETLGHAVSSAQSGEAALQQIEAGLPLDLVILDMNMPGLGGRGTLPRLRELRPDLPVLLATGKADQLALELIATHPHTTLLPKPFSLDEMRLKIQVILNRA